MARQFVGYRLQLRLFGPEVIEDVPKSRIGVECLVQHLEGHALCRKLVAREFCEQKLTIQPQKMILESESLRKYGA